jgi:APA family basic amino acid/polyamine antiporter
MTNTEPDAGRTTHKPALARNLSLTMVVLYGLGVTVGAGIYVLIGAAAARAGPHAPIAFLIAAFVMGLSAASFAELASRLPVSAGEAAYVEHGLKSRRLGLVTGLMVVAAALISSAAIAQGAAGYLGQFIGAPAVVLTLAVIVLTGLVAAWGISEAVWIAAFMTVVEIGGLLVVIVAGLWQDPGIVTRAPEAFEGLGTSAVWPGILGATMLAFFAFIGFEAMVNVAEEVERPDRTLPIAIAITLVAATVLYILVVWVASHAVPRAELAASGAPLSLVFERVTGASPVAISVIAILATVNGVIVQTVLASRVLYGMARLGSLHASLGEVHEGTRTPLLATAVASGLTAVAAVTLPLERLADLTTQAMLVIFLLVNVALLAMKRRGEARHGGFSVPGWVPAAGAVSCLALLVADVLR